jgi:Rrf2 family transcriptional regulator, iron-sulfur cluster assembly transcription factor
MKLTTKGRFAVTAMLDIALHEAKSADASKIASPVTLADISERQSISLSYLEQLFSRLRKKGLVSSVRGPGGGYKLAKNAVDEQIDATQCGGHENCKEEGRCMTHDLWASLNKKILDYLADVSLGGMVSKQLSKKTIVMTQKNKQNNSNERVSDKPNLTSSVNL